MLTNEQQKHLKLYFILKRLQAGGSAYHRIPKSIKIGNTLQLHLTDTPAAKIPSEINYTTKVQKLDYTLKYLEKELPRLNTLAASVANVNNQHDIRAVKTQNRIDRIKEKINILNAKEIEQKNPIDDSDQFRIVSARAQTYLTKDELIDNICIAVQAAHSLRILHRKLSLDSFIVQEYVDPKSAQVKLTDWSNATFNGGNSSFKSDEHHQFRDPNHYVTPEMARMSDTPEYFEYGFEYDMWGVGMVIFEIMYNTELDSEIDPVEFTNEWLARWIDSHPATLNNAALYKILLKVLLTVDPVKRASSYAIKNMCDGPQSDLFGRQQQILTDDNSDIDSKFLGCPPISLLLGNFADDQDKTLEVLRTVVTSAKQIGECQCSQCRKPKLVNLQPSATKTVKTDIMRQLMRDISAECVRKEHPSVVLCIFDTITQAIMNGDHPIIPVESQKITMYNKMEFSDMTFEYRVSNYISCLQNFRVRI